MFSVSRRNKNTNGGSEGGEGGRTQRWRGGRKDLETGGGEGGRGEEGRVMWVKREEGSIAWVFNLADEVK